MPLDDSLHLTSDLARLADSRLAEEIVALDMRALVSYTDYLLICSARNERQADAIAEQIRLGMKQEHGLLAVHAGHSGDLDWKVLDYLDCVVHIFTEEARSRYDLEDLWHEAPRVELDLPPAGSDEADAA